MRAKPAAYFETVGEVTRHDADCGKACGYTNDGRRAFFRPLKTLLPAMKVPLSFRARAFARTFSISSLVTALAVTLAAQPAPAPAEVAKPGPFFEPDQPFFQTQVEVAPDNFVVRGVLLPLASGYAVLFDQELLRVAALWRVPEGKSPVTERTMAQ